jgi:hypothetical protein
LSNSHGLGHGYAFSRRVRCPVEAVRIAVDYPLVTFDMVRKQQTNVAAPDAEHAPRGQMIKMRTYPAVDNYCCAAPNARLDPIAPLRFE